MRKKVLIVNDDGIFSEGIVALARALREVADCVVAAPDAEKSASGHSLSVHRSVRSKRVEFDGGIPAYAIDGTPADCVKFALFMLVRDVDMVVSGINRGSNLGTDVMYSGTVSAALEASYLGYRAVAVSRVCPQGGKACYAGAARFTAENLDTLYALAVPRGAVININYPDAPVKGVMPAHLGIQEYNDEYIGGGESPDEYWLTGAPVAHNRNRAGSDVGYAGDGFITVSPVALDRTDYAKLDEIKKQKIRWRV